MMGLIRMALHTRLRPPSSWRPAATAAVVAAFFFASVDAHGAPATAPVPGNRVEEFCKAAPAPTVVRAKVHADADLAHAVDVECVYGAEVTTEHIAQRFFGAPEDETLLVSLQKDGNVVGTAWPVFKEKVSLELGIPDMSEEEAVALLQSPKCQDDLRAFRDHGVRPTLRATPIHRGGCARCSTSIDPTTTTTDLASGLVLLLFTIVARSRLGRAEDRATARP